MVIGWSLLGFHLQKFLCAVLVFHFLSGRCSPLNSEGMALMSFRSNVEVDPYGVFSNWNPEDSNPCRWSGVHCVNGKVEMLDLDGFCLGGILPPDVGKLSHLKSLVLNKNNFFGVIPREIGQLTMLEILDLRTNNFSGSLPAEFGKLLSLKHILLCNNTLESTIASDLENFNIPSNIHYDMDCFVEKESQFNYLSRKVASLESSHQKSDNNSLIITIGHKILHFLEFKLVKVHSYGDKNTVTDIIESSAEPYSARRELLADNRRLLGSTSNLPAASVVVASVEENVNIPSTGSGSFPAISDLNDSTQPPVNPLEPSNLNAHPSAPPNLPPSNARKSSSDNGWSKWLKWIYIVIPIVAVLIIIGLLLMSQSRGATTIGPWKTGLSGQLQKAFVTGVPKLQRPELEAACEDFSNIIEKYPEFIVYKGTLSSGVEIAVASTVISPGDWSRRSETRFREKIDILSRVNHKNFINLIGYCEEENPFMRMMVFEYAPNGSLFEHLHVKELELDWGVRMRIIMGITYCLQYMHHEINPPVSHPNLQSSTIYLTDDYAAKVAEMDVWKEVIDKKKLLLGEGDLDNPESAPPDPKRNVYDFGLLLIEIISGQPPFSKEHGSLVDWAAEYINGNGNTNDLIDPLLEETFKKNELDVICEVIHECVYLDPVKRPSMKEVASRLKEVLAISPDSAAPRLSPLWWAELEILSVEA